MATMLFTDLCFLAMFASFVFTQQAVSSIILPTPCESSRSVTVGDRTRLTDLRFQASVKAPPTILEDSSTNYSTSCSATRISKFWLLSAAHCGVTTRWVALLHAPTIENRTLATLQRVYYHPRYRGESGSPNFAFDIALIRFRPPDSERSDVSTVRPNDSGRLPFQFPSVRKTVYDALFYHERDDQIAILGDSRLADTPKSPLTTCSIKISERSSLNERLLNDGTNLCIRHLHNRCSACLGDSGRPVLQYDELGDALQVGVLLCGEHCLQPSRPAVAVRVAPMLWWFGSVRAAFENGVPAQSFRQDGSEASDETADEMIRVGTPAVAETTPVGMVETPLIDDPVNGQGNGSIQGAGNGSEETKPLKGQEWDEITGNETSAGETSPGTIFGSAGVSSETSGGWLRRVSIIGGCVVAVCSLAYTVFRCWKENSSY